MKTYIIPNNPYNDVVVAESEDEARKVSASASPKSVGLQTQDLMTLSPGELARFQYPPAFWPIESAEHIQLSELYRGQRLVDEKLEPSGSDPHVTDFSARYRAFMPAAHVPGKEQEVWLAMVDLHYDPENKTVHAGFAIRHDKFEVIEQALLRRVAVQIRQSGQCADRYTHLRYTMVSPWSDMKQPMFWPIPSAMELQAPTSGA